MLRSVARSASVSDAATGQSLLFLFKSSAIKARAAGTSSLKLAKFSDGAYDKYLVFVPWAKERPQRFPKRGAIGLNANHVLHNSVSPLSGFGGRGRGGIARLERLVRS